MVKLEDIKHAATIRGINKHNLNPEQYENIEDIRLEIRRLNTKIYRGNNKSYFNSYMKERYKSNPEIKEKQKEYKRRLRESKKPQS